MNKKTVAEFFNNLAPQWDGDIIRNEIVISSILDNAGIKDGMDILDVACGTGVLFPDYLKRGVESVTAIDISEEMAKIAQGKFPQVHVICGDVENTEFGKKFDAIMVYNAFPHFPDPENLIRVLASLVKPGGRLSVAHGMSRAALQNHHAGRASQVSIDLLHEKDLAALFAPYFDVDVIISNDRMYQVAGTRRDGEIHSHGGHSHAHAHSEVHDHSHNYGHKHFSQTTPMEELLALMKYMVMHNDAHAQEMAELADQLRESGKLRAYEKIMDAVADFDILNAKFDAVLKELMMEENS
ncbi:MAG: class I SAM-dependent methyltransferase [Oscillospiraceae bacterium]|nr:class I SAM-dependent methyltransferase [Oscillospiraceae bacterium]